MKITEEQLQTFNENFKICIAQTKTTFYELNEYLELDDFESPDESISQDNYQKPELNVWYIDDYPPISSDIDHEIFSIETKQGQHVHTVQTIKDVHQFITEEMNNILKNQNYFNQEMQTHLNDTSTYPQPILKYKNQPYQPVTQI